MNYHSAFNDGPRRRLTRDDLLGSVSISYLRFSSSGQDPKRGGSTIDRQVEVRDDLVDYFQLKLDRTLEDRALSASKGHHRKRGNLAVLLEASRRGDFLHTRTVLIIEAMDRLFREGIIDVMPILSEMIKMGLVIVTGDRTIWCEASINGSENHKLIAEINAAKLYAERLAEFARGAHKKRRSRIVAVAEDQSAAIPELNGRSPGWLIKRDKIGADGLWHDLHPEHSATLRCIFEMCAAGDPVKQIAATFNREGVPTMPWTSRVEGEWRAARVGAILRDRKTLGFYRPMQWQDGKRVYVGPEVKAYPQAIDAGLWLAAKNVLDGRTMLIGRKGVDVPMLFSRHAFCRTCGAAMRCETGGRPKQGVKPRNLVCARYLESRTCTDGQRYDLNHFEVPILYSIIELTGLVPKTITDEGRLVGDLAALQVEIERQKETLRDLAPSIRPSTAFLLDEATDRLEAMQKRANELELEIEAATAGNSSLKDTFEFLRSLVGPASRGDVEARERLRSLLIKIPYRITGTPTGGIAVEAGGQSRDALPEAMERDAIAMADEHHHGDADADELP
ncbi:recombinase family protein [Belnapia rosea]|uniref:Recombinase n=1 Tax=Belnapia rosea TaxID=938405 RepID=A0A1G6P389_9PROT|nr:recombinase family protein [Belnapia rosea]SDC74064.1 Recombinase [Belnapia rosea]